MGSKVKRENYINVQGFMVLDLNLKGNELLIYAIIYGFSQEENQVFSGGLQYIADWTNSTKQGVIKCLKSLLGKGYIEKQEEYINGVKFCKYRTTELNMVVNNVEHPSKQSSTGGGKQSSPNNIDNNKINNNKINNKENIIDENFEKLWGMLKSHPNDRKSKVTKKRKKELYDMGVERTEKAIQVYLATQNPLYYHKRDNFLNEIIDNYLDKEVSDFPSRNTTKQSSGFITIDGKQYEYQNGIVTINDSRYEYKKGKFYVVGGSDIAVDPFAPKDDLPF